MWLPAIFASIVALEHLYIMILEMFGAESQTVSDTFKLPKDFQHNPHTKLMLANQGLYNGFIAVGIILSLLFLPAISMVALKFVLCLFIGFVVIAACYGAVTVSKKIFWLQGLPAIIAILVIIFTL